MNIKVVKISQLEKSKRMGHDIKLFHESQLKEKDYMSMIKEVSKITSRKVERILKNKKEIYIVEIGAGSGILSLYIINMVIKMQNNFKKRRINLIISEPDLDLLKFAIDYISNKVKNKKKFKNLINSKQISFVILKAQDIAKLKLNNVDLIVSSEVFHHLPYHLKIPCIRSFLRLLSPDGYIVIGDNFVANRYNYLDKNNKVITKRKIIAPKVAQLLKEFWTKLFKGKEWPESFKLAYQQQKEGFVECKTSLPHLIKIILTAKGKISEVKLLNKKINQTGGYAVLVAKNVD